MENQIPADVAGEVKEIKVSPATPSAAATSSSSSPEGLEPAGETDRQRLGFLCRFASFSGEWSAGGVRWICGDPE